MVAKKRNMAGFPAAPEQELDLCRNKSARSWDETRIQSMKIGVDMNIF